MNIEPECLLLEGDYVELIFVNIYITNQGSEEVNLYWEFEPAEDFPLDWKFQIGDLNLHYNWGVTQSGTSTFLINRLDSGETGMFTLKVQSNQFNDYNTYNITGSSYGTLKLYDNPDFIDPVAETSCVVSNNNIEVEDLVIYPNPTTDIFQLNNDAAISSIRIYDIIGRQVSTLNHKGGEVHNISMLSEGMYLVRLIDQDGEVVKTVRLNKWY